jgi:hypothetical protein
MSFGCQLSLCGYAGKRNLKGSLDASRSMFCSYELKAASAAGIAEDVDRNANDWAAFEARPATEKPPSSSKSPKADSIVSDESNSAEDATE